MRRLQGRRVPAAAAPARSTRTTRRRTIYSAIVRGTARREAAPADPPPVRPVGSTADVDFDTTKTVWTTDPSKSHLNYVVLDSDWEAEARQTLEEMDEVRRLREEPGPRLRDPVHVRGQAGELRARLHRPVSTTASDEPAQPGHRGDRRAPEGQGRRRSRRRANHWVPAVNNHGGFGRWAFLEVTDPWDAEEPDPRVARRAPAS